MSSPASASSLYMGIPNMERQRSGERRDVPAEVRERTDALVSILTSMGFDGVKAGLALQLTNNDLDRAVLALLRDGANPDEKTSTAAAPSSPAPAAARTELKSPAPPSSSSSSISTPQRLPAVASSSSSASTMSRLLADVASPSSPSPPSYSSAMSVSTPTPAAPASSSASRTIWTCPRCTVESGLADKRCVVCNLEQPEEYAAGAWKCVACTIVNQKDHDDCNVCGAIRILTDEDKKTAVKTCSICFDDIIIGDMHSTAGCRHSHCKPCFSAYLQSKIGTGLVLDIHCPTPNCTRIVVEDEFKALVEDPVVFAKYARFKRNAELSRNPAVRWCQTPGCESAMFGAVAVPKLDCPLCRKSLCFVCNIPWHTGKTCEQIAKAKAAGIAVEAAKGDVALAEFAKRGGFKQCLGCKTWVEKTEGCDKLQCRCGYKFCFKCGQKDATCRCSPGHGFYPLDTVLKNWQ